MSIKYDSVLFFVGLQILVISFQWFDADVRVWQKSPNTVNEIPEKLVDYSSSQNIIHIGIY
jgi:hypothetical protein